MKGQLASIFYSNNTQNFVNLLINTSTFIEYNNNLKISVELGPCATVIGPLKIIFSNGDNFFQLRFVKFYLTCPRECH